MEVSVCNSNSWFGFDLGLICLASEDQVGFCHPSSHTSNHGFKNGLGRCRAERTIPPNTLPTIKPVHDEATEKLDNAQTKPLRKHAPEKIALGQASLRTHSGSRIEPGWLTMVFGAHLRKPRKNPRFAQLVSRQPLMNKNNT